MTSVNNRKKVLVVDGSDIVLDRMRGLLHEVDSISEIFTARGFEEALAVMATHQPEIVLLEIALPGKSGFDLLAFIKAHHPNTRTMILTNLSGEVYRQRSYELGADYFIDKSGEFELINRIIGNDASVAYPSH
ncbi:MAG TPA: hypothetical protein DCQ34_08765 [Chitinophagaceae bacterium]|nr:hypothetical protein [Chitinophagaceae bacterium]HCY90364.1 hypothetical protein [Chitinophagaceae bacterium]HRF26181.1 response regulator [Ferruginibacter sp.]